MPLAVTHVLTTAIVVDLFRDYYKKYKHYFTIHTLFIAGVGGVLPDIDIPIGMMGKAFGFKLGPLFQHGGITHTLLFALLFFIPGFWLWQKHKHKKAMYFYVLAFGIVFHMFLDWFLGGGGHGGIMWLYPFSTQGWMIGLLNMGGLNDVPQALDALILLAWLWHEELRHKISSFI